ncbi:LOG family protein [Pseudoduganella namucuonensis]|uniref:Rossmann fold nucleotide-binding protein n=1 Tax=Pseudoduganella namucuonensis TaxID=1035707 RepID=A0A1I7KMR1_9BURK|nr:Rossmann fold nucleotide-binding protein [Pseudoduganella namucuonensis]SFU98747.1 hypothetical protein SAMN05216552_101822 [Pseudoduganella namucuonensis]
MKAEISNASQLKDWLDDPRPAVFQAMNLLDVSSDMAERNLKDCAFLGCVVSPTLAAAAAVANCLVLPPAPDVPFDPYIASLYTPDKLYDKLDPTVPGSYNNCLDKRIYDSYADAKQNVLEVSCDLMLLRRMHDASITESLDDWIASRKPRTVAIMGGHDLNRDDPKFANAARLAMRLAQQGFLVATGGGPGAMEAANLGAYAAGFAAPERVLDAALAKLAEAPKFSVDIGKWLRVGYAAWKEMGVPEFPEMGENLGIPTWFYGHEPANVFATRIAKYFENSVREEGLLAIAQGGIVFTEGNAGTVQEIFQDACQNYYRTYDKYKSPMVLLDRA